MSDIALRQIDDADTGPRFDFALETGDLALDDGLITPAILSLFCDRLAATDDAIPDGSTDRRGWWGDLALDGETTAETDLLGSRLWLLERSKAVAKTRTLAKQYAAEALNWLATGKIVGGVAASAALDTATGRLDLAVAVRKTSGGQSASAEYDTLWTGTL